MPSRQKEIPPGTKFGNLTVLACGRTEGRAVWKCLCGCGKYAFATGSDLRAGRRTSCGCMRRKRLDLEGETFGDLVVVAYAESRGGKAYWLCRCKCGKEKTICAGSLLGRKTNSCGCRTVGPANSKFIDITGQKFGGIVADQYVFSDHRGAIWQCKCDCGEIKEIPGAYLRSGAVVSCGCSRRSDFVGKVFGELTVLQYAWDKKWKCKCTCGQITYVQSENLRHKTTRSCGCKKDEFRRKTCNERYGCDYGPQNSDIMRKIARSHSKSVTKIHWKTGESLVCVASYEKAVVEYLNENKIDFLWQLATFWMPDGKTYRPDLYIIEEDIWVEIKGFFREPSKQKWLWFNSKYPNSELWDKEALKEMEIIS